jgi:hypothetical protein
VPWSGYAVDSVADGICGVPGIAVFVSVDVSVAVGGVPVTVDVAETVGVVVALVTVAVGVPLVPVTVNVVVV